MSNLSLGPLEPEPRGLLVLAISISELEAVRDAIQVAQVLARGRLEDAGRLADHDPVFAEQCEAYWRGQLASAELSGEAIERAAPGRKL